MTTGIFAVSIVTPDSTHTHTRRTAAPWDAQSRERVCRAEARSSVYLKRVGVFCLILRDVHVPLDPFARRFGAKTQASPFFRSGWGTRYRARSAEMERVQSVRRRVSVLDPPLPRCTRRVPPSHPPNPNKPTPSPQKIHLSHPARPPKNTMSSAACVTWILRTFPHFRTACIWTEGTSCRQTSFKKGTLFSWHGPRPTKESDDLWRSTRTKRIEVNPSPSSTWKNTGARGRLATNRRTRRSTSDKEKPGARSSAVHCVPTDRRGARGAPIGG